MYNAKTHQDACEDTDITNSDDTTFCCQKCGRSFDNEYNQKTHESQCCLAKVILHPFLQFNIHIKEHLHKNVFLVHAEQHDKAQTLKRHLSNVSIAFRMYNRMKH